MSGILGIDKEWIFRMKFACKLLFLCFILWFLPQCSVIEYQSGPALDPDSNWVLLPIQNYAEAPQAGERVETMLETLLRSRGILNLKIYPTYSDDEKLPELNERRRFEQAMKWAKGNFSYAITGTVTEWRYKSGLDGEPAVGLNLQVIELGTGTVLWSASGAMTGWGRESLSGTSQKLLDSLLNNLRLKTKS